MNEFSAKKLGEVLAFTEVKTDTLTRGATALALAWGQDRLDAINQEITRQKEAITHIAQQADVFDIVRTKADNTGKKLMAMRDLYVGDQWDNAVELMEWSGFFEGAAIVHFALVRGVAETINHENLLAVSQDAIDWHYEMLEYIEQELASVGQSRSI